MINYCQAARKKCGQPERARHSRLAAYLMYAKNTTLENSIISFEELDFVNWLSKCSVREMNRSAFWELAFNITT